MADASKDYINYICSLYNSSYDDRIENTAPPTAGGEDRTPGEDWMPGVVANHKSLAAFQRELAEQGIKLSTSKIKKILITGGLWTTETTREIQSIFNAYTATAEHGGEGLDPAAAIKRIAEELGISTVSVSVSLPYSAVVYNLPEPSANAKRCRRWKERKRAVTSPTDGSKGEGGSAAVTAATAPTAATDELCEEGSDEMAEAVNALHEHLYLPDQSLYLWKAIIAFQSYPFTTSGRGSREGVKFTYEVSKTGSAGGRHYDGEEVPGYGNELFILRGGGDVGEPDKQLKKSISRSTVDLALKTALEMDGKVKGPKKLNTPGAGSYLYPMLIRFGVIKKGEG